MPHFRLRPQFSLRSLLVVVTCLAVALGGGIAWWQRTRVREQVTEVSRWEHYPRRRSVCTVGTMPKKTAARGTTTPNEPPQHREVYEFYLDLQGREVRHGLATMYDLEGHRLREDNWRQGRLHGPWMDWHPDGSKLAEGEYRHGQPQGTWVSRVAPGVTRAQRVIEVFQRLDQFVGLSFGPESYSLPEVLVEQFDKGKPLSVTGWDQAQEVMICEAHFVDGELEGEVIWRSPTGEKIGRWNFQNGLLNGSCQAWHNNGAKAMEGAFVAGKEQGLWQGWYEDGTRGESGNYEAGQEHGSWTWWNADGSVDCQAEYDHGRALSLGFPQFPSIPIQGMMSRDASQRILKEAVKNTSCDFNATSLKDVVYYFTDLHNVCIRFNQRAIEQVGVLDTPISYNPPRSADGKSSDVTLYAALQKILTPLGLVPVIRHEVLLITTRQDADAWRERSGVPQLFNSAQTRLVEELRKPTSIEFNETPLKDMCRYLADLHTIKVSVDPALSEEDQGLPISGVLKGTTLAAALEFLCDQYGLTCTDTGTEVLVRRAPTARLGSHGMQL